MLAYHILNKDQIIIVEPQGPLAEVDFLTLASEVDLFLARGQSLKGLLIHTPSFPGWENFAGLATHLRFTREHHKHIKKIALVSDSILAEMVPKLLEHFINADIKQFDYDEKEAGLEWLRSS